MRRKRTHPRAGRHAVRHVSRETTVTDLGPALAAGTAADPWPDMDPRHSPGTDPFGVEVDVSRETPLEDFPPLSPARVAKLEALTAQWMRDVRVGGPQPEDTLLYAAPMKPPPPPPADRVEAGIRRAADASREAAAVPPPTSREAPSDIAATIAQAASIVQAAPYQLSDGSYPPQAPRVVRDWVSRHDDRSREFDVAARLRARVPVQDRVWATGPVFDQGTTPPLSLRDASGCVGMGGAAAANALILQDRLPPTSATMLDQEDARGLYARAQELDTIAGADYAGTSVLAGMLAGREAGLWPAFLWAFGTRDIAQAVMQVGPVVVGIRWTTGMDEPGRDAVIRPTGDQAGGHCLAVVGLVTGVRDGRAGPWFVLQQSRGRVHGDGGLVYLHHKDLGAQLRGIGEAAIPVPPGGLS